MPDTLRRHSGMTAVQPPSGTPVLGCGLDGNSANLKSNPRPTNGEHLAMYRYLKAMWAIRVDSRQFAVDKMGEIYPSDASAHGSNFGLHAMQSGCA
jgi:hypothetical protein